MSCTSVYSVYSPSKATNIPTGGGRPEFFGALSWICVEMLWGRQLAPGPSLLKREPSLRCLRGGLWLCPIVWRPTSARRLQKMSLKPYCPQKSWNSFSSPQNRANNVHRWRYPEPLFPSQDCGGIAVAQMAKEACLHGRGLGVTLAAWVQMFWRKEKCVWGIDGWSRRPSPGPAAGLCVNTWERIARTGA